LKLFAVATKIFIFQESDNVFNLGSALCLQLNESVFVFNAAPASSNIFECSVNQLEVLDCVTTKSREVVEANLILCFNKEVQNTIFSSPDCSLAVKKVEADFFETKIVFQPATIMVSIESLMIFGNLLSDLFSYDTAQPPTQSYHRLECSLESLEVFVGLSVSSDISSSSGIHEFLALSDSWNSWNVRVVTDGFFKTLASCKYGFYFSGRSIVFLHSNLAAACSSEVSTAVGDIGLFIAGYSSKYEILCDPFCHVENEVEGPLISIPRDVSSTIPTSVSIFIRNLSLGKSVCLVHFVFLPLFSLFLFHFSVQGV
jgi:hypothetical protein